MSRTTTCTDPRRRFSLFHRCTNPNSCPAAESSGKSFARRFTHGARGERGRANQAPMICRWRIKTRARDFFQTPSARRPEPLLKCPLKRWFVCWSGALWPCQQVICWALSHVKRSCKTAPGYTCDGPWQSTPAASTLTKQIKKTHANMHGAVLLFVHFLKNNARERLLAVVFDACCGLESEKKKKIKCWAKRSKSPPVWSSNYLLKHLLKSPPWFFQHAFHNWAVLRIYCLQMANERRRAGAPPLLPCTHFIKKPQIKGFAGTQQRRKQHCKAAVNPCSQTAKSCPLPGTVRSWTLGEKMARAAIVRSCCLQVWDGFWRTLWAWFPAALFDAQSNKQCVPYDRLTDMSPIASKVFSLIWLLFVSQNNFFFPSVLLL